MTEGGTGAGPAVTEAERLALSLKALKVVRHDLRNLLASVTIIADRIAALEDQRLASAGPHLVASMEQTVALSRAAQDLCEITAGTPAPVALAEIAEAAIESVEGAEVETDGLAPLRVSADPEQLRRLLSYLIDNAARATADGGRIVLSAVNGGGRVTITLRDDGQGVPDYALPDLLTPFAGTKRRGGTGLGLPTAAALAAVNDGTLTVERSGPGGTVIVVELPAA